jgi:hypothetical protein
MMAPLHDWVYGWAMLATAAAGGSIAFAWFLIRDRRGVFQPHEQLRERTPWPPPPLPQDTGWVTVSYDRPQREPLALPRGDR